MDDSSFIVCPHTHHVRALNIVVLPDPLVIYRYLEGQYEEVNGQKTLVIMTFSKKLSEFMGDKVFEDGSAVKRFIAL